MGRRKRRILAERRGMLEAQAALKTEIQTAKIAATEAQAITEKLEVALAAAKAKATGTTTTGTTKTGTTTTGTTKPTKTTKTKATTKKTTKKK